MVVSFSTLNAPSSARQWRAELAPHGQGARSAPSGHPTLGHERRLFGRTPKSRVADTTPSGFHVLGRTNRVRPTFPAHEVQPMSKILMVLTSHNVLGSTGRPTGFWLEEFTAPYYVFLDAGQQVTVASPKGGHPPSDPKSDEPANQTASMTRFKSNKAAQPVAADT